MMPEGEIFAAEASWAPEQAMNGAAARAKRFLGFMLGYICVECVFTREL